MEVAHHRHHHHHYHYRCGGLLLVVVSVVMLCLPRVGAFITHPLPPSRYLARAITSRSGLLCATTSATSASSSEREAFPPRKGAYRGIHLKKSEAFAKAQQDLGAPAVVLVEPFLDENVGSVARAMLNFGLVDLRLVNPVCDHLTSAARARSSGADAVLENAKVFNDIPSAIADLTGVMATSARIRDMTQEVLSPEMAAKRAVGSLATFQAGSERYCLMFGSERNGLSNEALAFADALVHIPAHPNFSSLNIAQAVNLVTYEYWKARTSLEDGKHKVIDEKVVPAKSTRLARKDEVEAFMKRLVEMLEAVGFHQDADVAHRQSMYDRFRGVIARSRIDLRDVNSMQGALTSLLTNYGRLAELSARFVARQEGKRDKVGEGDVPQPPP